MITISIQEIKRDLIGHLKHLEEEATVVKHPSPLVCHNLVTPGMTKYDSIMMHHD